MGMTGKVHRSVLYLTLFCYKTASIGGKVEGSGGGGEWKGVGGGRKTGGGGEWKG